MAVLKSINLPQVDTVGVVNKLRMTRPRLKTRSKKVARWSIVAGNAVLLIGSAAFIIINRSASQTVRANTLNSATSTVATIANPLDRLSSAQIALTVAQMAHMPELTAIRNQADSDSILLSVVPNDSQALSKPQVVATAEKSKKDIIHYVTQPGDTVTSLSAKFNVTPSSIRWSNNIWGDSLTAGTNLVIPPINGVVYTVKAGDTPATLASRFQADQSQIIVYNDAEISGLTPGEQILIPNGSIAPAVTFASYFAASYGGNGYDFGYCTWYVANKVAVPTNWGNANTWALYARMTPGWVVSTTPVKGSIAQTSAGWEGHVAYVEDVSADGTMIKYSDMNGLAGWGRVGYSDWVSYTHFQHYIYRG